MTPIGSCMTSWRMPLPRPGTMRPYERRPSSAYQSMMSAETSTSPRASTYGLPCSITMILEIASWRSRMRSRRLGHDLGAVVGRGGLPLGEAGLGGFQRGVEVGLVGVRQGGERLLGRGVDHLFRLAGAAGLLPRAVDIKAELAVHGILANWSSYGLGSSGAEASTSLVGGHPPCPPSPFVVPANAGTHNHTSLDRLVVMGPGSRSFHSLAGTDSNVSPAHAVSFSRR